MTSLRGLSVLITGAKGGLGAFITARFLAAGAAVTGVSRSIAAGDFPEGDFWAVANALADDAQAKSLLAQVVARRGGVDAVVHLVGGFAGDTPISQQGDALVQRMLEMNYLSASRLFSAALPHLAHSSRGLLVAIGSPSAEAPPSGQAAYAASKAALSSLIRSIRAEYSATTVRASLVIPNTLDIAANRAAMPGADTASWTKPEAVAEVVARLAAGEANPAPGENIRLC